MYFVVLETSVFKITAVHCMRSLSSQSWLCFTSCSPGRCASYRGLPWCRSRFPCCAPCHCERDCCWRKKYSTASNLRYARCLCQQMVCDAFKRSEMKYKIQHSSSNAWVSDDANFLNSTTFPILDEATRIQKKQLPVALHISISLANLPHLNCTGSSPYTERNKNKG